MEVEKIRLRPVEKFDLELLRRWRNDPDIMARTRQWRMLSMEDQHKWFSSLYNNNPPSDLVYVIESRMAEPAFTVNWQRIGVCGLCHIDWIARKAEISIYIGNVEWRRKGVGQFCVKDLIYIAFDNMNLTSVFAEIYSFNTPGIKLFEACDFKPCGKIERNVYKNGIYHNSLFYEFAK